MDLDCALTQVEFVGDYLVGLAFSQRLHNRGLARREHAGERAGAVCGRMDNLAQRQYGTGGHEDSSSAGEAGGLGRNSHGYTCRDVAASAAFKRRQNLPRFIGIGHHDHRHRADLGDEMQKLRPNALIGDLPGAQDHKEGGWLRRVEVPKFIERSHRTDMQGGIVFCEAASEAFSLKCTFVDNYDEAVASMFLFEIGTAEPISIRQIPIVYCSCRVIPEIGNSRVPHATYSSPPPILLFRFSFLWLRVFAKPSICRQNVPSRACQPCAFYLHLQE
ncbi:hypothetical protein MPLB_1380035 [Mesorhizobium sp. ORS 3324]|nr:hypothetical protein MPLB_1380035 [Mesorhizobium sp. ORS 3324]